MLEKIKKIFRSTTSRNGSYSVGMIVLVIGIAVVVNMIAGQIPESYRNIDVSEYMRLRIRAERCLSPWIKK